MNGFMVQWIKFVESTNSGWQNLALPTSFTSQNTFVAIKMLNRPTSASNTWAASYTAVPYDASHVRTFKDSATSETSSIIAIGY